MSYINIPIKDNTTSLSPQEFNYLIDKLNARRLRDLIDVQDSDPLDKNIIRHNGSGWVFYNIENDFYTKSEINEIVSGGNIDLSDYVPYIGATKELNLGSKKITIPVIQMNTAPHTYEPQAGLIDWNLDDRTINIHTGLGNIIQVGQELMIHVYNNSGQTLTNGSIVYPTGTSTNGLPNIGLAIANSHKTIENQFGVLTTDIPNNSDGFAVIVGQVNDINTSNLSIGVVYISDTEAGKLTSIKPSFPHFPMVIGQVLEVGLNGSIVVDIRANVKDTFFNFFNGTFREKFNFTVSSDGLTTIGSLDCSFSHNIMTMLFRDGMSTLDVSIPPTVNLVAGTDTNPQINYVYIPSTTKQLTVSTSGFPSGVEHIKVANIVLKSHVATQTDGALMNRNFNDFVQSDTNQGFLSSITRRLRLEDAKHYSGVQGNISISPSRVDVSNTGGIIYQLNEQQFPARNTLTGDFVYIANDFSEPFKKVTNLYPLQFDALGKSLRNSSFSFVHYGIQNQTGELSHTLINKPINVYPKNDTAQAIADANNYAVYSIPSMFRGTAFLIARYTFSLDTNGTTWTLLDVEDLRGRVVNNTAGTGSAGGGAVASFDLLTDTPSSKIGHGGKAVIVGLGQSSLEYKTLVEPNIDENVYDVAPSQSVVSLALSLKEDWFSKNTAFNKNFGTILDTVCQGNDIRLSDARTPLAHTHAISDVTGLSAWMLGTDEVLSVVSINGHAHSEYEPVFTKNTAFNKNFGTINGTVAEGNHTHSGYLTESLANTIYIRQDASSISLTGFDTTHYLGEDSALIGDAEMYSNDIYVNKYFYANRHLEFNSMTGAARFKQDVSSDKTISALGGNSTQWNIAYGWGNHSGLYSLLGHNHTEYELSFLKNTGFNKNFGTTAGTVVEGNDSRLSDARIPLTHTHAISDVTGLQSALNNKIESSLIGSINGVAELDSTGKILSTQLPSFVDDVIEANTFNSLPVTGEVGKIYVTLDNNKTYRWSGTIYTVIGNDLALGEIASTAYRGDRGKIAYDHSQSFHFSGSYLDLSNTPSTFTPSAHGHLQSEITGLTTELSNIWNVLSTAITTGNISSQSVNYAASSGSVANGFYRTNPTYLDVNSLSLGSHLYAGSTGNWTNRAPSGHNGGALFSIETHPQNYYSQMWFDTANAKIYTRAINNGVIGGWLEMWHSGNFTPSNYSLTNHNHSGLYSALGHIHAISDVTGLSAELLSINEDLAGHIHSGLYEPIFTKNTAFNKNFGTILDTVCQGNDIRLSDARTPLAHTHAIANITSLQSSLDALWEEFSYYSPTSHNHSSLYASLSHTHAGIYLPINGKAADAELLDGLNSSVSVIGNTIVARDVNGYVYASYFNSNRGNENSVAASYIYDAGDGWMRKKTLENVKTEIVTNTAVLSAIGYTPYNNASIGGASVNYANSAGSAPANGGTSSQVTINYNNDSGGTYQMLWGSGNSVFGTSGIYCNPSTDAIYATDFAGTSDVRQKENIKEFVYKKIDSKYKTFNFIGNKQERIGVIAQELELTNPEFVRTNEDGIKSVSYSDLHSAEIANLKHENEKLNDEIESLKNMLQMVMNKIGI